MFTPDEIDDLRKVVRECAANDKKLLEELRRDARDLIPRRCKIQPRSATAVSLVASDGGNNQIRFDPFNVQLIRVVDSYGKKLCLDAVSASTDLAALDKAQFNADGSPRTPLGILMRDLAIPDRRLSQLSHMMPDPVKAKADPTKVPPSWVQVYRDLCEWAVLYELICYKPFATDTIIVRDGLLRSKQFRGDHFVEFRKKIEEGIDRIYRNDRRKVFLVGLAKHTQVLERYNVALTLENVFPDGDARYVEIPRSIERKAVRWERDVRGPEEAAEGEETAGKFVAGTMYFVRFGKHSGDPIWSVDLLTKQKDSHQEIFGYLEKDAIEGFPVPYYPMCLQRAHSHAEVVDFDLDILQDEVTQAVRDILPDADKPVFDAIPLKQDVAGRRYS